MVLERPLQLDQGSALNAPSPVMSHVYAQSVVSDGASLASASLANLSPSYVAQVNPPPEYISQAGAAQLATQLLDSLGDADSNDSNSWHRSTRADLSHPALALVNAFLDKQLYDFLNTAKSTSLVTLRPAVADVLKKNLARVAIASAEANLEDLLALQADGESEDEPRPSSRTTSKWSAEFTWKRLRLRVMMRSEKSEFDIDDYERYVNEEDLSTSISGTAGVISLAAEIFLAGVLDYLAELLLSLATQSAVSRARRRGSSAAASRESNETGPVLIQEPDVEKAALNSPLDRQWRSWRKSLRAASHNSHSQSAASSPVIPRRGSLEDRTSDRPEHHYPEHILASNIPLPMTKRDVDEIEVPGLARDPDEPEQDHPVSTNTRSARSQSLLHTESDRTVQTVRPISVPTPLATPFVDIPGAWPGETSLTEKVQHDFASATSAAVEGATEEEVSRSQSSEGARPESKDSAHTEVGTSRKSSRSSESDDVVSSLKSPQRPKRLAIYGPSSSRYSAANISLEGMDPLRQQRSLSPESFLASRNLGASSPTSLTPTEEKVQPIEIFANGSDDSETHDESDDDAVVKPLNFQKSNPTSPLGRSFPSAEISRQASDASKRTPISEQRVSLEFMKSRRSSKMTDNESSSPGKRGSLRQISTNRNSLDERRKHPVVSSPLTSEQEFDMLLNSKETVKFTLTPETVRDIPDRGSGLQVRLQAKSKHSSSSKESVSKQKDSDTQSIRSFRSATWSIGGSKERKQSAAAAEVKRKTSISRPIDQNTSALPSGLVAREPVMQTESTRDFADFIRSTGPDKEPNPVIPLLASRSMSSLRATAAAQSAAKGGTGNISTAPPTLPVPPKSSGGKYIPRSPLGPPKSRSATRSNLTARGATGNSDSHNDLIDFIRSGPPGSGGKARVPNHIAPFADFDDEDDTDLRTVITSTSDFPRPSASIYRPSTSNSRTGLLQNGAGGFFHSNSSQLTQHVPAQSPKPPSSFNVPVPVPHARPAVIPAFMPASGDAQRKRSRIKDPYAIPDDSDDEEDLLSALPGDRGSEPPVGTAAAPLHAGSGPAQGRALADGARANSINSVYSSASQASPVIGGGKIPTTSTGMMHPDSSPKPGYASSTRSVQSANSTAAIRPAHITSQVSSGGLIPRSGRSKMEVRSAGASKSARLDALHRSSTNDLADFLMSSGPPAPPSRRGADAAPGPVVGSGGKPEKKKSSKFWQRKATYLDMP